MADPRAPLWIAQVDDFPLFPLLAGEGYPVELIPSIDQPPEGMSPALILIDGALPDAYSLCARLRQRGSVPIWMLVPNQPADIDQAYDAGASDVLTKPVYLPHLLRRIHAFTEQPSAVAESTRITEALRNTAAALSRTLDQNEVLDRILEQLNTVVPSHSANIMLIEAGMARVARWRGYQTDGHAEMIERLRLKVNDTPTLRWMIEHNQALVIPNVDEYAEWQYFDATDGWLKSYVSAPVRIGDYVIGFLNIDSIQPNRFSAADGDRLQIFADQAAIAIRNARLFDRVREQASEMERRVVQRTSELEYERGQMRAIVDAMAEGVVYTEYSGGEYHTRYVNQALEQMTGYLNADWNRESLALFRAKSQSQRDFEALLSKAAAELREQGYWYHEARLTRKNGEEFDAVTITTRVDRDDSHHIGLVTVIRDVSHEKAIQEQKNRFVAYASHELRTPLTNLKTRLYLMRQQPERMDEHLRVMDYITDRMKVLVEDLLDISRFERGAITLTRKPVALREIVSELVALQQPEASRKNLTLDCAMANQPYNVQADPERLAQVITNLLTNAIRYTPEGGHIEVRLRQDDRIWIEVADTGIGIAEEHLPNIFQPFYRVAHEIEGTGLGLSITKEIVELHGGDVTVSSKIGVGTTFCFWLPLPE